MVTTATRMRKRHQRYGGVKNGPTGVLQREDARLCACCPLVPVRHASVPGMDLLTVFVVLRTGTGSMFLLTAPLSRGVFHVLACVCNAFLAVHARGFNEFDHRMPGVLWTPGSCLKDPHIRP